MINKLIQYEGGGKTMKVIVKCVVCKLEKVVNGQKQIDHFRSIHNHGSTIAVKTGEFIEIKPLTNGGNK